MKILRKCIAFVLAAGLMVSAMTVFADDEVSQYDGGYYWTVDNGTTYYEGSDPSKVDGITLNDGDVWKRDSLPSMMWDASQNKWVDIPSGDCSTSSGGSDSDESSTLTQEDIAAIESHAESAAVQGAAYDEGFADVGDMYRAAEKGMSAGEFYNNAVVSTPGIENAIAVGQGGNLIVNGVETNMSATISKVTNRAYVDSVRVEQEGTVLNVVDVQYPAVEATINFYTPGITGETEIVALQYNAGTWVDVEVAEVRADHVVLNMKGNGVVAFIAK